MNRTEFCEMMAQARQSHNCSLYAIQKKMNLIFRDVKRIETGEHNFNLIKAIDFLAAFNGVVELSNGNDSFTINNYPAFIEWLINTRTQNYTQRTLAEVVGCTYVTIANIERQKTVLSIDTFLKLMDVLGYTIKITSRL